MLLILWSVFIIQNASSQSPSADKERMIYISSSEGDDSNPGTLLKPLKSLSALRDEDRVNTCILLKAGDVFFDRLKNLQNCEIGKYGLGENPVMCGLFMLKDIEAWEYMGNDVWRLDFSKYKNFSGYQYSSRTKTNQTGNVGLIYSYEDDHIYGHLVKSQEELLNDGDFFTSDVFAKDQITQETFHYLYFKWHEHPRALGNLCFVSGSYGVVNLRNCNMHDVSIVGFGYNAITSIDSTTIKNCSVDLIGGSILIGYGKWIRFGNGIEVNVSNGPRFNVLVDSCMISRTYDTATTIQGSRKKIESPGNIHFTNNIIIHCRQGFEWYMNAVGSDPEYNDCSFQHNTMLLCGDNMFNIPSTMNDCCFLCQDIAFRHIEISDNICVGGNYLCTYQHYNLLHDNIVYLYPKMFLLHQKHGELGTIYPKSESDVLAYKDIVHDDSRIFYVEKGAMLENYGYKTYMEQIEKRLRHIVDFLRYYK